jgi:hypothetical protein
MADVLWGVVLLVGYYPLALAWRASARTTLRHALGWALGAWGAWALALSAGGNFGDAGRYAALCLTGCAGVAVLGARRPGAGAWNFVVLGLLAVLLRPLLEGLGALRLEPAHWAFLGATLAVPLVNYLPTRLGPALAPLGGACGLVMARLAGAGWGEGAEVLARGLLAVTPWVALLSYRPGAPAASAFDREWRGFRDRYGLVWGLRLREQFNRAAAHAGWPVRLTWSGLQSSEEGAPPAPGALLDVLRSARRRFDAGEGAPPGEAG